MASLAEPSDGRLVALPRKRRDSGAWLVIFILTLVAAGAVGYLVWQLTETRGQIATAREDADGARLREQVVLRKLADAESAHQDQSGGLTRELAETKAELADASNQARALSKLEKELAAAQKQLADTTLKLKAQLAEQGVKLKDSERLRREMAEQIKADKKALAQAGKKTAVKSQRARRR